MRHGMRFLYLAERYAGSGGGISHDPISGWSSRDLTRLALPRAACNIATHPEFLPTTYHASRITKRPPPPNITSARTQLTRVLRTCWLVPVTHHPHQNLHSAAGSGSIALPPKPQLPAHPIHLLRRRRVSLHDAPPSSAIFIFGWRGGERFGWRNGRRVHWRGGGQFGWRGGGRGGRGGYVE